MIVGLGGAGGIAAHVLTHAGIEVVALEAGPNLDATKAAFDEIGNDRRQRLSSPKARLEIPTWRPSASEAAKPSPWSTLGVNAVGGSTLHYAGLNPRFLPWNFESRRRTIERYGDGAVPAGSTLADWPLTYAELEPFYDAVEYAIGVAGSAGNVRGCVGPTGNPFEGPRERNYPMRPLRRSGWTELTAGAARRLDWHPFPAPAALNSEPFNGNPECTYCGFCDSNCCHRNAKGATSATVIPRALETGLLTIESSARVVAIEVDGDGLARGVTYVKSGEERFQPARIVLLAGFTYENSRLLLASRSTAWPDGLSNNHGQVGQHYMVHIIPRVLGLFPGRALNIFSGPWSQATCLDDWNADNFDHTGLGFVGGGMLAASHEMKPIGTAGGPLPATVPRWGSEWKGWLKRNAQSIGSASAQLDSLSYETNRLDLDPVATDAYGVPRVRITYETRDHERRGAAFLRGKLETWLLEAGASETWSGEDFIVEARHAYGGTRMGDSPETSVADKQGFSHEIPTSAFWVRRCFPQLGATIQP